MLCFHRFSIVMRWIDKGKLMVIQRCRRCDKWRRREVEITVTDRINPEIKTYPFVDHTLKNPSTDENTDITSTPSDVV